MNSRRVVVGVVCAGLLALGWMTALSLGLLGRGTGYYFPTWHLPPPADTGPDFDAVVESRLEGLTNVATALPMVLAAAERPPSKSGLKWNDWADSATFPFAARAPRYYPDAQEDAVGWLAGHAGDTRVAAAVVARWKGWPEALREAWLNAVDAEQLSARREYVPMLVEASADSHESVAQGAAVWLARCLPVDGRADAALAAFMERNRPFHAIVSDIVASLPGPGPGVVRTLEGWRASGIPSDEAFATVMLARLDPARWTAEEVVPRTWPRLASGEQLVLLQMLSRREFAGVVRRPWTPLFAVPLVESLSRDPGPKSGVDPKSAVLAVLANAGTNAVAAVPALVPLMSATNRTIAANAAAAFVSVAEGLPRFVPLAVPQLTNKAAAPALVLWLTSLGPDAAPAREAIDAIAADRVTFAPDPRPVLDPNLMRRYGLAPLPGALKSPEPLPLRPSQVRVELWRCPGVLLRWWPGVRGGAGPERNIHAPVDMTESGMSDEAVGLIVQQLGPSLESRYARSGPMAGRATLAELAVRCRVRMTNGVLPEMR